MENLVMVYVSSRRELAFRCETCRYEKLYVMAFPPSKKLRTKLYIENFTAHSQIELPLPGHSLADNL